MASISRDRKNGRRTIQFVAADGTRKSIRLGKVSQRVAEEVKVKIEQLNATAIAHFPVDNETAKWVSNLGADLANKLAAVGLITRRGTDVATLGALLDAFIARRTDIKPNTKRNLESAKARLVEFFGADKLLREITPDDADAWLLWLKEKYASGTAGRTLKRAKQFFRAAVRKRVLPENPFADLKNPSEVNESRKYFVTEEEAQKVLNACPNAEWRLLFALSRFGGLRCPSEHLVLQWNDMDWHGNRFWVRSPKTEHHEGH